MIFALSTQLFLSKQLQLFLPGHSMSIDAKKNNLTLSAAGPRRQISGDTMASHLGRCWPVQPNHQLQRSKYGVQVKSRKSKGKRNEINLLVCFQKIQLQNNLPQHRRLHVSNWVGGHNISHTFCKAAMSN